MVHPAHGDAHRIMKDPIKFDPRKKVIIRPDGPLPIFFPPPKAIQVIPIYDDDDNDSDAPTFYPSQTSSYPNNDSRSRPTSRLSSRENSPKGSAYRDSEYDYKDYRSGSDPGSEPRRTRRASRSGYGYGYRQRRRRSYSHSSGRGRTQSRTRSRARSRTRTGYASGTGHDYSGYDYPRTRPGYQARSRPANVLTPSGKPYSQTPQPHSRPVATSVGGPSHGHERNNHGSSIRLPGVVTPPGIPYSPTPQPYSIPNDPALTYIPSKSTPLLQPVLQVPGSMRSSNSHGSAGTGGGFGGGEALGGYQPMLPPQSVHAVHSHHSHGGGGHVRSRNRSHRRHRSSSSPSNIGRSSSGSSSSTRSVPRFTSQSSSRRGPFQGHSAPLPASYSPPGTIMSASSASSRESYGKYNELFDPVKRSLEIIPPNPNFCRSNCVGRKKAVYIGINYVGQKHELQGCAENATEIKELLIYKYHFKSEDILLLIDNKHLQHAKFTPKPTKREIFNAMAWLVKGARMHDSLFFCYSGHGGQLTDALGKEADSKEVIYPVDYDNNGGIIDAELYQALVEPLPAGCRLTAIFDSCHSGSVLDLPYLYSAHGRRHGRNHYINRRARNRGVPSGADVVCFAACKDDGMSADVLHGEPATGLMSSAFIQALQIRSRFGTVANYEELVERLSNKLGQAYQKPQISATYPVDIKQSFHM